MFDPTYKQLKERGFTPTRLPKKNGELPRYLSLHINDTFIITEHVKGKEYTIHRLKNKYGRCYAPYEIEGGEKFDNIKSLDELIEFLVNDTEPSELNLPN